jgi:hypothetical protein
MAQTSGDEVGGLGRVGDWEREEACARMHIRLAARSTRGFLPGGAGDDAGGGEPSADGGKPSCAAPSRKIARASGADDEGLMPQLKFFPVDKFHAKKGHNSKCKNNPYNVRRLMSRVKHVNTSVAEQVFSWFRGYARTFNEMRGVRHIFLALYYAGMHNELVSAGCTDHLNKYNAGRPTTRTTRGYACNANRGKASKKKAMKTMRKIMKNRPVKAVRKSMKKAMKKTIVKKSMKKAMK